MGLRFEIYFAKFLQDISKPSIFKKKMQILDLINLAGMLHDAQKNCK